MTNRPGSRRLLMYFALPSILVVLASSCATVPYEIGKNLEQDNNLALATNEPQFERGRPHAFLDFVGSWIFGLPSKILLLNFKVDNHHISSETEAVIFEFVKLNNLKKVKVRLNQYRPGAEWRRLAKNRAIHPGWRWTVGMLTTTATRSSPEGYSAETTTIPLRIR